MAKRSRSSSSSSSPTDTLYKTELCRKFSDNGICKYGNKCSFAHGYSELRAVDRHPKYKTDKCRSFFEKGFCSYGHRCTFFHGQLLEGNEQCANGVEKDSYKVLSSTYDARVKSEGVVSDRLRYANLRVGGNISTSDLQEKGRDDVAFRAIIVQRLLSESGPAIHFLPKYY